jgi:hypothetical protein
MDNVCIMKLNKNVEYKIIVIIVIIKIKIIKTLSMAERCYADCH